MSDSTEFMNEEEENKMALDLEAIRKRVAQLSGVKQSRVQLWKPPIGEHRIRVIPWPNQPAESPFIEKYFYYLGDQMPMLSPFQFGKPDPIQDLTKALWATRKEEDKELAKKLRPQMRAYACIIDRSNEDQGPIAWSLGKQAYTRLLSFFLDEDTQLWTDPGPDGWDLKVQIVPGKGTFAKTMVGQIDTVKKQSPLHRDPEVVKKWLAAVPDISDMYPVKTEVEVKAALDQYLSGGEPEEKSEGTTRNESKNDELEKLATEVGAKKVPVEDDDPKPTKKQKSVPKKVEESDDGDASEAEKNIDKMFDQLINDN